jgi:hypothetical protein
MEVHLVREPDKEVIEIQDGKEHHPEIQDGKEGQKHRRLVSRANHLGLISALSQK